MTEKRFMLDDAGELIDKETAQFIEYGEKVCELLNALHEENKALKSDRARYEEECRLDVFKELSEENEQLKEENKLLKNKYERKDRQLQRTKKDIEKYTDYFMNELNWDCDRIIREVFK